MALGYLERDRRRAPRAPARDCHERQCHGHAARADSAKRQGRGVGLPTLIPAPL